MIKERVAIEPCGTFDVDIIVFQHGHDVMRVAVFTSESLRTVGQLLDVFFREHA